MSTRNWVVVVDTYRGNTYLGAVDINADIYNGPSVKDSERCGCKRIENALRFTERGAKRIAKGYTNGFALEAK